MKKIPIIILILFLIKTSISLLPYHAHGFNELKLLKQQIKKGARSFKIDISFATKNTCEKYSNKKNFDILEYHHDEEIGCLALRGDNSSIMFFNEKFDTTDDFLAILISSEILEMLKKEGDFLFFELKFNMDISFTERNKLIIDFVYKLLNIVIEKKDKFVINESQCFIKSFKKICEKSPENCNEKIKKIAYNKKFVCKNEKNVPMEQNLFNEHFNTVEEFCQIGFGEYINSPHAFQFWEPSSQKNILKYFEDLKFKCPLLKNHSFKFTTNVDIDLFRVIMYSNNDDNSKYNFVQKKNKNNFLTFSWYLKDFNVYVFLWKGERNYFFQIYDFDEKNFFKEMEKIDLNQKNGKFLKADKKDDKIFLIFTFKIVIITFSKNDGILVAQVIEKNMRREILMSNLVIIDYNLKENNLSFYLIEQEIKDKKMILKIEKREKDKIIKTKNFLLNFPIEEFIEIKTKLLNNNEIFFLINEKKQNHIKNYPKDVFFTIFGILNFEDNNESNFFKILGKNDSFEIEEKINKFILIQNHSAIHYGHGILNNNDKNECSKKEKYHLEKHWVKNHKNVINYYFADLKIFFSEKKKDLEFINVCNDKVFHGQLGFAKNTSVNFIYFRNTFIPYVITENAEAKDLDTFTKLFGGFINYDGKTDRVSAFEIPTDTFFYT